MAKRRGSLPATLDNWTPARAAKFARTRVDQIKMALMEIAVCYDEVDNSIGMECDRLRDEIEHETGLTGVIADALAEGRSL